MKPKFTKGQKVTIIPVKNYHTRLRHSELQPFVSREGTVMEFYPVGDEKLPGIRAVDFPRSDYFYTVLIDDREVKAIPEECLQPSAD